MGRILIIVLMLACSKQVVLAQYQSEWLFERYYINGHVFGCAVDNMGGIFLSSHAEDSVCGYGLGEIVHISSTGALVWEKALYYELPCLDQTIQAFHVRGDHLYYSVQDTSGAIMKADSAGAGEFWKVDTGFTLIATDIDAREQITAYVPQWSEVFSFDSSSVQLWSYALPYSFAHQITTVISNRDRAKIVAFEYTDPSQSDYKGVGIVQLDSNGIFMWDTFINQQTAPDEDLFVDIKVDQNNNIYVLTKDMTQGGGFLTKIDENGIIVAQNVYLPTTTFDPSQLELDTLHALVYVAGRSSSFFHVLKFDFQLNGADTMLFDRSGPYNVLAVNEYGYLFHAWLCDTSVTQQLYVEVYNHNGLLIDVYSYWDSARFSSVYPHSILFDSVGGIFVTCDALDTSLDETAFVLKLTNPLGINDTMHGVGDMRLYPNPATSKVSIVVPANTSKQILLVYNAEGMLIAKEEFFGSTAILETQNYASGIYFVSVTAESGQHFIQKLIVQHP